MKRIRPPKEMPEGICKDCEWWNGERCIRKDKCKYEKTRQVKKRGS